MSDHTDRGEAVASSSGAIIGTGLRRKQYAQFAGLIVAVVVGALGAGAGVSWMQHRDKDKQAAAPNVVAAKAEDAQKLALSGNYDQATQQIQQALKNPTLAPEQKYTLYFQQGVTYEDQQKYSAAITAYKQADTFHPTQGIAEAIARVSAESGDKATAIAYYKKAIARISPTSPVRGDAKAGYEQQIKILEGQ